MQSYAEDVIEKHVGLYLQPQFFKEKKGRRNGPYDSELTKSAVENIVNRSIRQTDRYRLMKKDGATDAEILSLLGLEREIQS